MGRATRRSLVVLALVVYGCGTETDAQQGSVGPSPSALFVDMDHRWSSTNIPTCWENPDAANKAERDWVRSAARRTWETASRVRFTGWDTCPLDRSLGIRIRISDERPHTKGLGRSLDGKEHGMSLNFTFARWFTDCAHSARRQACIESIAVHEFGHALGFDHEQDRADTPGSCHLPRAQDLAFGDFDHDGLMDVFRSDGNEWQVTRDAGRTWLDWNTSTFRGEQLQMGDFNGDGETDVFRTNGTNWYVSWSGSSKWQELNGSAFELADLRFGDFDGDGRTDVFRTNEVSWYVSWGGSSKWQELNTSAIPLSELRFGDFDGDGRTDVFRSDGSTWYVSLGGATRWQARAGSKVPLSELRFGDFDGNGTTDVFRATGSVWEVSSSANSSWRQINTSAMRVASLHFGHFNGGRQTDVFRLTSETLDVSTGGSTPWRTWKGAEPSEDPGGDLTVGKWDEESVMNYCNPRWNNGGALSPTDVAGVRQAYGPPR